MWSHNIHLITMLIQIYGYSHRSTNGRSKIMACCSERRIGIDSRRLVRRHSHLSLSPSHAFLAEGNPDEEKIGAFGVGRSWNYFEIIVFTRMISTGFYSLFSVTGRTMGHFRRCAGIILTNPPRFYSFIPGQWTNFYWKDKKDQVSHVCTWYMNLVPTFLSHLQLYVRRGTVPSPADDVVDPWTTFQMTLREPGSIPPAFDLTRFLASSITFMTHLSEVSVYFDDKRLVKLSKDCDMPKEVPMLKGLKGTSPQGMMSVKSIETMREFRYR